MRPNYDEPDWAEDASNPVELSDEADLWIPQKGREDSIPYACEPLPCQFCPIKCVKKLFSFFRLRK